MFLTPELLEHCYRAGAFPMAGEDGEVELYRADPRCILEPADLHVSKSLARVIRSGRYEIRVNHDYEAVVRGCADRLETWISEEIVHAYVALHRAGKSHSVEAYRDGRLVGGLYGVALGGFFGGESMFSRTPDASKVCFVALVGRLIERGYKLLDCQIYNDHLGRLGATEIPEDEFLGRLADALAVEREFN
ncbi:leucyl/phenylalanyl-tRNA--protein transferase [Rubrobacter indicoceani]|uniref:leucyl/phenylalanyl-tRNA--protein transferase n=1 Tax=Rubrobacter indicoceani TaxID=2051957 RepID=UPI000E5AE0D7|nr:leucyl/phenylalanyl-tRNA--protein transferase [Rubrobacter indicoceani]